MIQKQVSWTTVKSFISARDINAQWYSENGNYVIFAIDGNLVLETFIPITDPVNQDQADFENNYQSGGNKTIVPPSSAYARTDQFILQAVGYSGVATKNSVSTIDYRVGTAGVARTDRYIRGMELIVKNHVAGDFVSLQIVDADNLMGFGAGVVLTQFATNWFVTEDSQSQGLIMQPLRAHIPAGLYVRIQYHSVGLVNDVSVYFNLVLDQKTS